MSRATGVYELERETFGALGARVPREPPLDPAESLPVPSCWIVLWVYFIAASAISVAPYLRLVDVEKVQHYTGRGHFFGAAAESMRRILLDRARDKRRLKRGGDWRRLRLDDVDLAVAEPPDDLPALDEALQKLAQEDPLCAELVKLRFFAGLTLEEAAPLLDISRRTADRYWAFARSWLYDELSKGEAEPS